MAVKQSNEKKYGKLQWFLFVILIPLLFAITISLVVLTIAGINVFDVAKEYSTIIPGVSSTEEHAQEGTSIEEQIYTLEATIADQKYSLDQLNVQLSNKDSEIASLKEEIEGFKSELEEKRTEEQDIEAAQKELSKMYESMSAKKAAAILSELNIDEAANILKGLKTDTKASIIERMDPEKAATLTTMLTPSDS